MSKHGLTIDVDASLLGRRHKNIAAVPDRSFTVNVGKDGEKRVVEMLIYDVIGMDFYGDGITAKRVEQELAAVGEVDEIRVLINSPGGIIYEALGIYNALARHPANVVTHNVGAAWSAASWVLQAGDERLMSENATFMMHNGQGLAIGDRRTMLKEAELLEKMDGTMALTYAKRSGRKVDTFRNLMDEETWYDANEAVAAKVVDSVVPAKTGAKNLDPAAFGFNMRKAESISEPLAKAANIWPRMKLLELEGA